MPIQRESPLSMNKVKTAKKPSKAGSGKKSVSALRSVAAGSKSGRSASKSGKTSRPDSNQGYSAAIRWLFEHTNYEQMRIVPYNTRTFSLDRMRKLLEVLGNPHEQLKCVQVAGTKGKGSTCAMLASVLRACGYTTGLYASPHLVDLRERISIDGQMIPYAELTEILNEIQKNYKVFGDNPPSFFDIVTGAALRYFADQAVDIAILETGLGGRLDSTTAVTPLITAMTHISLDHMNILGKQLSLIAKEKAGIFKKGIPAISVEQEPEVMAVLDEVSTQVGAPLEYCGKQIDFSYRFEANKELGPHTRVSVTTPTTRWEHVAVPLRGEHQAHNCGLALSVLDKLKGFGFNVPEEKVTSGLVATQLEGRMEQVWTQPRVILDGAHNAVSIKALIRALGAHIAYDSLVMIFGCAQDKDVIGMLKQLSLGADKVIFTKAKNNPRAMEPEDLMHKFNEVCGKMAQQAPTLEEALRLAGRAVSREDLIIITGSFYLVGEAKKYFAELGSKKKR
ncbi:MAG: folylpolyglutamate synthase/dihydrofolate synthase family protein [Phycisphaeraceae bacterium]